MHLGTVVVGLAKVHYGKLRLDYVVTTRKMLVMELLLQIMMTRMTKISSSTTDHGVARLMQQTALHLLCHRGGIWDSGGGGRESPRKKLSMAILAAEIIGPGSVHGMTILPHIQHCREIKTSNDLL